MKVLYWTETFWPNIGGVEVLSAQLIPALQERNYEFAVITSHNDNNHPDESNYNGIPVYRFHFRTILEKRDSKQIVSVLRKVAKIKQNFKPDLIHINTCYSSIFFHQHTTSAWPSATLVAIHEMPAYAVGSDTILGRVLQNANWVVAVSGAMLNSVRRIFPEVIPRSSVIYNGLDMPVFKPRPLSFDTPRLLCLGRVVFDKGFDLALNAFASIIVRFPKARLIISGDGPARRDLERQAETLGVKDAVEFTGWISPDKVSDLINAATVIVVPSRWAEPFCLVAVQAAQMSRPTVATRVGGLPEVVLHHETGLLVEKEDSDQLAEAIVFLLEHPDMAEQMALAARNRAQRVFNLKRCVDAYDAMYRELNPTKIFGFA